KSTLGNNRNHREGGGIGSIAWSGLLLRSTYAHRECDHLLLHRCFRIADGETLRQIPPEERLEPAEAFILRGVPQFVDNHRSIEPGIGTDKDAVAQRQT